MISYHVLVDNVNNQQLAELNSHLIELQPEYINIMGGSRFEQALQYTEVVSNLCPDTRIILRHWPDDGILKRYNYGIDMWYADTIKPYQWWIDKQVNKYGNLIWLLDNESIEDDLTQYSIASTQAMHRCAEIGLGLAVGRFSAGNPADNQYSQLDEMWETLKFYNGLHIFSPNEYFNKPLPGYGVGSVGRYKLAWNRCIEKYNFTPETVIGEFGLAVNYDPYTGWRNTNLSEIDYAKLCLEYDDIYYSQDDITACVFSVGSWNGFDVTKSFYDTIETKISDWNIPVETNNKMYAISFENGIRIRETPINGRVLGYASFGNKFEVLEGTPGKQEWLKINYKGAIAYTAGWFYVPCSCE